MKFEAFDEAMRVLPGVTLDIKWETRRTYCVGDRIFVLAGSLGDETPIYVFKASELGFEMLVESTLFSTEMLVTGSPCTANGTAP